MQRESTMQHTGTHIGTRRMNMGTISKACAFAAATAFAFTLATGPTFARSPKAKEDQAQLKADQSSLAREKAQMKMDEKTLKAGTKSGKMAAESKDAGKVYKD